MSNHGEFSTMPARGRRRWSTQSGTVRPPVEWALTTTWSWPSRSVIRYQAESSSGKYSAEVGDVVRGLVGAQRAPVLPQVEGVEVVAARRSTTRRTRSGRSSRRSRARAARPSSRRALAVRGPPDQGRHHRAFVVGREADRLRRVRRPEDVGVELHARSLPAVRLCAAQTRRRPHHRLRVIVLVLPDRRAARELLRGPGGLRDRQLAACRRRPLEDDLGAVFTRRDS